MTPSWIAVDWGTTNFRAFLVNDNGEVLDTIAEPSGLLSVIDAQFSQTLEKLLNKWLTSHGYLPLVMAGMVGSRQGWHEVDYISSPCSINELGGSIKKIQWHENTPAFIVPGVSALNTFGAPEVMRGEEIQIFGLLAQQPELNDGFLILPGTHSKQALIENRQLKTFQTFMTGEMFSVMSQHSILGKALPDSIDSPTAFLKGVDYAQNPCSLSGLLFSARTETLLGDLDASEVHSYLSGLLIGSELSNVCSTQKNIWLIGSANLTSRYRIALEHLGFRAKEANGDTCFQHGLNNIYQAIKGSL